MLDIKKLFFVLICVVMSLKGGDNIMAQEMTPKTLSLADYIKENYVVLYTSPLAESLENTTIFLVAEQHDLIGHKYINSDFINRHSKCDDIILLEGIPSMHPIEYDQSLQSMWFDTEALIAGWDSRWFKDITGIDTSEVERVGIQLLQIQRSLVDSESDEQKEELKRQYNELIQILQPLIPLIQKCSEQSILDKVTETFAERVVAMTTTLAVADQPGRKVFVLAGLYHLWQDPSVEYFHGNAPFSLAHLYEFLNTKKAVVLIPKQDKTTYWNDYYQFKSR